MEEKEGNMSFGLNLLTLHSFYSRIEINSVLFGWKCLKKESQLQQQHLDMHDTETAGPTPSSVPLITVSCSDVVQLFEIQTKCSHCPSGIGAFQHLYLEAMVLHLPVL
jgi:hypothetical protein